MKNLLYPFFVLLITGCTSIGSSDFKCGGIESGIKCQSVSDMYKQTTEGGYNSDRNVGSKNVTSPHRSRHGKYRKFGSLVSGSNPKYQVTKKEPEALLRIPHGNADELIMVAPPEPDSSVPMHYQESKERVWINEFVDDVGVFVGEQRVYFASKQSGWASRNKVSTDVFQPLKNIKKD